MSVRHELNDFLREEGGHIGFAVRPAYRRRGIASMLLDHGLEVLAALGWAEALVACEDGNLASATAIETAGGRLRDVRPTGVGGHALRHYLVPTGAAGRGWALPGQPESRPFLASDAATPAREAPIVR